MRNERPKLPTPPIAIQRSIVEATLRNRHWKHVGTRDGTSSWLHDAKPHGIVVTASLRCAAVDGTNLSTLCEGPLSFLVERGYV